MQSRCAVVSLGPEWFEVFNEAKVSGDSEKITYGDPRYCLDIKIKVCYVLSNCLDHQLLFLEMYFAQTVSARKQIRPWFWLDIYIALCMYMNIILLNSKCII